MADVSIVIPIGPNHAEIAERAISSARAQTTPCEVIPVYDKAGRGPSWARNQGIMQCETRWIVFLDADDFLHPNFVKRALEVSGPDPGNYYVYTDWLEGVKHKRPSELVWCCELYRPRGLWYEDENGIWFWKGPGAWHIVTALIPTHWVKHLGGFDEELAEGGEDTEFWVKLTHHGCCGIHLPEPLVHYTTDPNSRSKMWVDRNPNYRRTMDGIVQKWGHLMGGCCGEPRQRTQNKPGAKVEDVDVLCICIWKRGKQKQQGVITGRVYGRPAYGQTLWVHPHDLAQMGHIFRKVTPPPPPPPPPPRTKREKPLSFAELADRFMPQADRIEPTYEPPDEPVTPVTPQEVLALANDPGDFWNARWGLEDNE